MSDDEGLELAFKIAEVGVAQGWAPFGAAIVDADDNVIAVANNTIAHTRDCTQHAELAAIQQACGRLGSPDLSGCTIYATCEPCPMCFAAIHWARIERIVSSATIADCVEVGFRQLGLDNERMKAEGGSGVSLRGGVQRDRGRALLRAGAPA
ncbi:MAG: nucleoside deaminase [Planctomycetota bacterium]